MSIKEVLSAPASPWQRADAERLIGSIRRDCRDHVIVRGEGHLRKILKSYLEYHHRSRTTFGLGKDTPEPRALQPPEIGRLLNCRWGEVSTLASPDGWLKAFNPFSQPSATIHGRPLWEDSCSTDNRASPPFRRRPDKFPKLISF